MFCHLPSQPVDGICALVDKIELSRLGRNLPHGCTWLEQEAHELLEEEGVELGVDTLSVEDIEPVCAGSRVQAGRVEVEDYGSSIFERLLTDSDIHVEPPV